MNQHEQDYANKVLARTHQGVTDWFWADKNKFPEIVVQGARYLVKDTGKDFNPSSDLMIPIQYAGLKLEDFPTSLLDNEIYPDGKVHLLIPHGWFVARAYTYDAAGNTEVNLSGDESHRQSHLYFENWNPIPQQPMIVNVHAHEIPIYRNSIEHGGWIGTIDL